jgi:NAD(P)-dependent dehydrogenase (short-subunit alcohol dehydrogenase family)
MDNPFSLKCKTILVTGGSSGIGKATAIECSKLGAKVIITGRNTDRLDITYKQLLGKGHMVIAADLKIDEELAEISNNVPQIDGLVNAAGILKILPFQFVNRKDLTDIFNVNFFAPVILTQKLIKAKKMKSGSSIIYISSIDGPLTAHVGNSMYAASKGAISAIVKSMALDLASQRIRVNCVLPGMTETSLIKIDSITPEQLKADMKLYPLKRYGKPEDIAYSIIYLLSDTSSWVTGSNLVIDGGFTLL